MAYEDIQEDNGVPACVCDGVWFAAADRGSGEHAKPHNVDKYFVGGLTRDTTAGQPV